MTAFKLALAGSLVSTLASAQPPGSIEDRRPRIRESDGLATTERWGGHIRLTGLSGIGALPGVNFGGEVALHLRRDEMFAELGLGRLKPEEDYRVVENRNKPVDLKLDLWTLRAGWSSMRMPMRAWLLFEVGEIAGARGMQGVVSRMVMGDTPSAQQWRAAGGGFGVAWPMSDQARLFGSMEIAIPMNREAVMLDRRGAYEADPFTARCSLGLEVGWR